MSSTRHEQVYHAAHGCQAAALSLTAPRLRGLLWACQVESKKNSRFFARFERIPCIQKPLSSSVCMQVLCLLKHGGLIAGPGLPHAIDASDPDVCQRSHGHTVTLAFCPFPSIIVKRPGFLPRRLPGKLIEHVAKGLDTRVAAMRLSIVAALIGHRRGARQGLDAGRTQIPLPVVIPDLSPWEDGPRIRRSCHAGGVAGTCIDWRCFQGCQEAGGIG